MTDSMVIALMRDALIMVLLISSPILAISLIVGLVISIFQTTTSIQEQTLTFVPKIIAVFIIIILFSSWMMENITSYTENLFSFLSKVGK